MVEMGECLEGDIGEERGAVGEEQDCGTEFEQVEDGFQSSFSLEPSHGIGFVVFKLPESHIQRGISYYCC